MNARELIKLTLSNINEDTDDTTVNEYREKVLQAVNQGYCEVIRSRYRPAATEEMPLTGGKFSLGSLLKKCMRVDTVTSLQGVPLFYTINAETVVTVLTDEPTVQVTYRYMPEPLAQDTDEPEMPMDQHACLADYAAYRMLGTGSRARQLRGDFFLAAFLRALARIQPAGLEMEKISHKYG